MQEIKWNCARQGTCSLKTCKKCRKIWKIDLFSHFAFAYLQKGGECDTLYKEDFKKKKGERQ